MSTGEFDDVDPLGNIDTAGGEKHACHPDGNGVPHSYIRSPVTAPNDTALETERGSPPELARISRLCYRDEPERL